MSASVQLSGWVFEQILKKAFNANLFQQQPEVKWNLVCQELAKEHAPSSFSERLSQRSQLYEISRLLFVPSPTWGNNLEQAIALLDSLLTTCHPRQNLKERAQAFKNHLALQSFFKYSLGDGQDPVLKLSALECTEIMDRLFPLPQRASRSQKASDNEFQAAIDVRAALAGKNPNKKALESLRNKYPWHKSWEEARQLLNDFGALLQDSFLETVQKEIEGGQYSPAGSDENQHLINQPNTPKKLDELGISKISGSVLKKLAGMTPMAEIIDDADHSAPSSPQHQLGDYDAGYPEDSEDLFSGGEPEEPEEEKKEEKLPKGRKREEKRREVVKESESEDERGAHTRGRALARGKAKEKKVERLAPEPPSRLHVTLELKESLAQMSRRANDPLREVVEGVRKDTEVQAKKTRVFEEMKPRQSPGRFSKASSFKAPASKGSKFGRGEYLPPSSSESESDEDVKQFRLEISREEPGPSTYRSMRSSKRGRPTIEYDSSDEEEDGDEEDSDVPATPPPKKFKPQPVTPPSQSRRSQRLQNTPSSQRSMNTSAMFRLRTMFSDTETAKLIEGVRRLGVGNWALIRDRYHFNRSSVDLKDKYRNLLKKGLIPRDILAKTTD